MDHKDNQEINDQQPQIEDLTVNEDQATEVKGGAQVDYFLRLKGVDGESTNDGHR
jgi:hypothetical protein